MLKDLDKDQRIFIYSAIGVIVTLVIVAFLLRIIWGNILSSNDKVVENSEKANTVTVTDLGTYTSKTSSLEEQLTSYSKEVISYMRTNDIDRLYDLLNNDYKEYYNINKKNAKELFESKGCLGKNLIASDYIYSIIDNKKVFAVNFYTSDKTTSFDLVIKEYSPNSFSIAFDNFVYYKKDTQEYNNDGVKFELSEQLAYIDSYRAKAKLTNLNSDVITLNCKSEYEEACYLKMKNNSKGITSSSSLTYGKALDVENNQSLNFDIIFNLSNLAHGNIEGIEFKDVLFGNSNAIKDLNFSI